jgi:D-xylose 1-dehydrogenase (NADP+, D-xylono-1,5-lactone-forming)
VSFAVPVKWGIMSTARINRAFLGGARQAAGIEVLAVASRDRASAERYAREQGIERAHGSYDSLLADPDVDVVYISLPNSLHLEWTMRALESGKHVLCEKPLGRRAADVDAAFDVAEREDRLLMEAFMYRHNPQTRRLTELVTDGAVGRVRMIRAAFSFVASDPADLRLRAALDGGALMDVGCYCVSGARLIAGEPQRVGAEQAIGGDGVDITFAATMRFPDDVLAHFDAGLALAPRDQLEVVGDEGALFLDDPWHCRTPVIELRGERRVERIEVEAVDSYRLEAENMSAAIRGQASLLLGREDAIGQARAIEALYESAQNGRTVTLR